ncbi:MAG: hypothetical protein J5666_02675, partial [Bacilli bacterium]|nr:hypothetical protein [Bacilli bacterium]
MKNLKLLMLLPALLMIGLTGCNNKTNNDRPYQEDFVSDGPIYRPIDFKKEGTTIKSVEVLGLYHPIKAAEFDEADVQIRVWYNDNTSVNYDFKEINIPIEYRHLLGEPGKHEFDIAYSGVTTKFEFTIEENPNFKGFTCYFYNKDKKLMDTEVVGYYQPVMYKGEPLPEVIDENDYQYTLLGWDHDTSYVYQNMQYLANYDKLEKRLRAAKPNMWHYHALSGLVNADKTSGKALIYLGRVYRVATLYSDIKELEDEDLVLDFSNYKDFGPYFNDVNNSIASLIRFEVDSDYNSKLFGNASEIVSTPRFANAFDSRYDFKGMKCYLEDGTDAILNNNDPYDYMFNRVNSYLHNKETIKKNEKSGYYRLALINDYDVYVSVSYNRLEKGIYEIGAYNEFLMSPVNYDLQLVTQHSYDGTFMNNFPSELV